MSCYEGLKGKAETLLVGCMLTPPLTERKCLSRFRKTTLHVCANGVAVILRQFSASYCLLCVLPNYPLISGATRNFLAIKVLEQRDRILA